MSDRPGSAAALAHQVCQALLRDDVHRTALGSWRLKRRCVLISQPRVPPDGEAERDLDGRPRFASGHWLTPHFSPSRELRRAVRDAEPVLTGWPDWERSVVVGLRAGVALALPGVGQLSVAEVRGHPRPSFCFVAPLRHRLGAAQERLLRLRGQGGPGALAAPSSAH